MNSETSSETCESLEESGTDPELNDIIEDELAIFENDTHYVSGILKENNAPVLAAITPTSCGWTCRSIYSNKLRHDYVSFESINQIQEWLAHDIKRGMYLTTDREGTVEHLANLLYDSAVLSRSALVAGPPMLPQYGAAEVVLQHLELGY